jgi:uncharacterized surface protein with fasciclin (FAS1) repeats
MSKAKTAAMIAQEPARRAAYQRHHRAKMHADYRKQVNADIAASAKFHSDACANPEKFAAYLAAIKAAA